MRKVIKDEIKQGKRNDLASKKIEYDSSRYKKGKDYDEIDPNALSAMYKLARYNMERQKAGKIGQTGRAPKFETVDQLQDAIMRYWDYLMAANDAAIQLIPDVEGLCSYIGVNRSTLLSWEREDYRGFAETIKQAKNDIAACKKQIGMRGGIPPIVMAMDFNNNHGYTQKQEVIVTPNNPLGDAATQQELLAKYDTYAQLPDRVESEKAQLPEEVIPEPTE